VANTTRPAESSAALEYPGLVGVGGWLWLFCFLVTFYPLGTLVTTVIQPWDYWGIPLLCYAGFEVLTGYSVWRAIPKALLFTKIFLITRFCLGAVTLVYHGVEGSRLDCLWDFEFMLESTAWSWYFKKSKRVRATFGGSL
jgi:hypothetical protein